MPSSKFKFKFYLNSKHIVVFKNNISPTHQHTWEIVLRLAQKMTELSEFNKIEAIVEKYLSVYDDKVLNTVEPFDKLNPTMENMGHVFYEEIQSLIKDTNYELESVEVSENPTRTYMVTNYVDYHKFEDVAYQEAIKNEFEKGIAKVPLMPDVKKDKVVEKNIEKATEEIPNEVKLILDKLSTDVTNMNKKHLKIRKKQKKKNITVLLFICAVIAIATIYYMYLI